MAPQPAKNGPLQLAGESAASVARVPCVVEQDIDNPRMPPQSDSPRVEFGHHGLSRQISPNSTGTVPEEPLARTISERPPISSASAGRSSQDAVSAELAEISAVLKSVLPKMKSVSHSLKSHEGKNSLQMTLETACPAVHHVLLCLQDTTAAMAHPVLNGVMATYMPTDDHDVIGPAEDELPQHDMCFLGDDALTYDSVLSPSEADSGEEDEKGFGGNGVGQNPLARQISRRHDSPIRRLSFAKGVKRDSRRSSRTFEAGTFEAAFQSHVNKNGENVSSFNACFVHPEKPFKLIWDFCSLILILTLMVVIPYELAFYWNSDPPVGLEFIAIVVDLFFASDICISFVTAYHEGHGVHTTLITDMRSMGKNYARGWLVLDVLATFPYSHVVALFTQTGSGGGASAAGMLRVMRIAKVARLMKVLRVLKLGGLMQILEEKLVTLQSMTVAFQLAKMTVEMAIVGHIVACMWYAVAALNLNEDTWLEHQNLVYSGQLDQYVAALYFAITTGTTVGYGDIVPQNTLERFATSLLLILSVGYITQFLGHVSEMVRSLRHNVNILAAMKREALLFMTTRAVSKDLQFKVLRYIEHTSETQALTAMDEKLMGILSKSLQSDLALAVTGKLLREFPLFAELGDDFVSALCRIGHTQRAAGGDTIVYEEQPAHEMFWVAMGEVSVTRKGRHLTTLRGREWFGELVLFFEGVVRSATIRCETHCEFFVLHHDEFHRNMLNFKHVQFKYDNVVQELRQGDVKGLKLKCAYCGSIEHLSRDCPEENDVDVTPVSSRTSSPVRRNHI